MIFSTSRQKQLPLPQLFDQMMIFLMVFCLLFSHSQSSLTKKFGLLTVTHTRGISFQVINTYLNSFAIDVSGCYSNLIEEINIIWNNEISVIDSHILDNQQKWKIPVKFYETPYNSMNHRYRLPDNSTSDILFSLDDDIIISCEIFTKTFQIFKSNMVGSFGRMVSTQVRGFGYQGKIKQFIYQGQQSPFYTIVEPGAVFLPRKYLELYYVIAQEITSLRSSVLEVHNCDDIYFYAIFQHFYPELHSIYFKPTGKYKNTDPKIGQSRVQKIYFIRNKCVDDLSEYFGYNPLRYFQKNYTEKIESQNWEYSELEKFLRQRQLNIKQLKIEKNQERNYTSSKVIWGQIVRSEIEKQKKIDEANKQKQLAKARFEAEQKRLFEIQKSVKDPQDIQLRNKPHEPLNMEVKSDDNIQAIRKPEAVSTINKVLSKDQLKDQRIEQFLLSKLSSDYKLVKTLGSSDEKRQSSVISEASKHFIERQLEVNSQLKYLNSLVLSLEVAFCTLFCLFLYKVYLYFSICGLFDSQEIKNELYQPDSNFQNNSTSRSLVEQSKMIEDKDDGLIIVPNK